MSRRVLLFGSTGQVGDELRRAPDLGEVIAPGRESADFSDPESLRAVVRHHRPNIIINAAAYTAVDKAETETGLARNVNGVAPGILAEEAESVGACLVHYSTDYVFDGRKASPYFETDATNPLSEYGRSKLIGEELVAAACRRHLIFRTSWVVGAHGANFLKTILRLAANRSEIRVVTDQCGVPTSAGLLVDVTTRVLETLRRAPRDDSRWGLFHVVPAGETNWYAYARYVIERAGQLGMTLSATPETVSPIVAAEYPAAAARPANSRLDTEKLRSLFPIELPEWKLGIDHVLNELILGTE